MNLLVISVLHIYFLLLGLLPSGDWDESDPNCFRTYGPHAVYTVQARIPDLSTLADEAALLDLLERYLTALNEFLPIKLHPYALERYRCLAGCGDFLYVSVYSS